MLFVCKLDETLAICKTVTFIFPKDSVISYLYVSRMEHFHDKVQNMTWVELLRLELGKTSLAEIQLHLYAIVNCNHGRTNANHLYTIHPI